MRKKQTFLLTILNAEDGSAEFCGKIKVIASGETYTFTSLAHLYEVIHNAMGAEGLDQLADLDLPHVIGDFPASASRWETV